MTQTHPVATTETGASFSPCGQYRYTLWRTWGVGPLCNFLMLNPSTAGEVQNDPTVERCQRRAESWGYGGLIVTNLYAFRSTDPKRLKYQIDPVGPDNADAIRESAGQCQIVVCAWGAHGGERGNAVLAMLREFCPWKLLYLRFTSKGAPEHPLFLPYTLKPIKWLP